MCTANGVGTYNNQSQRREISTNGVKEKEKKKKKERRK
jgi:hypothetical protein